MENKAAEKEVGGIRGGMFNCLSKHSRFFHALKARPDLLDTFMQSGEARDHDWREGWALFESERFSVPILLRGRVKKVCRV